MEPGSVSERHTHRDFEQIWIVERGEAILLLGNEQTEVLCTGDIVRTPAGEIHGVENKGKEPFVYLSVTAPSQDFSFAYNTACGSVCRHPFVVFRTARLGGEARIPLAME